MNNHFYIPQRAMAIAAHPDDIEFGCAGTVARWVQQGCKVYVTAFGAGELFVNISETIDLKIAALQKHVSQFQDWDPEPRLREWSETLGKDKEMAYAESFRVLTLMGDEEFAKLQQANSRP